MGYQEDIEDEDLRDAEADHALHDAIDNDYFCTKCGKGLIPKLNRFKYYRAKLYCNECFLDIMEGD